MANMSYCRFENTSIDLQDCLYAMGEASTMEEMDLSSYERDAMDRMAGQCRLFLEQYEYLKQTDSTGEEE